MLLCLLNMERNIHYVLLHIFHFFLLLMSLLHFLIRYILCFYILFLHLLAHMHLLFLRSFLCLLLHMVMRNLLFRQMFIPFLSAHSFAIFAKFNVLAAVIFIGLFFSLLPICTCKSANISYILYILSYCLSFKSIIRISYTFFVFYLCF